MKWSLMSEQKTSEITKDKVFSFEKTLKAQLNLLKDAIPKNQKINFSNFGIELGKRVKENKFNRTQSEYFYDWYHFCLNPISQMMAFRLSNLRYMHQALNRMIFFYNQSYLHEFAYNFRLFIEVSALFNRGIKIISKPTEFLINFKTPNINSTMEYRKEYFEEVLKIDGDFVKQGLIPLMEIARLTLPVSINIQGLEKGFRNNDPLRPKKGQLGENLIPERIMKALQEFEQKINNLHPFYDLLSEFLHPNSYVLGSIIDTHPSKQYSGKISTKSDDEKETIREFFIRINSHKFIEKLVNTNLEADKRFNNNIVSYTKKIRIIVNKTLGLVPIFEYEIFKKIMPYECLCGSGKKIIECCIKTSKKDLSLLNKHGQKFQIKNFI